VEVFRICKSICSKKLTASGKAARWTENNQFVLYAGASRSLATLENVVHLNNIIPTEKYEVNVISLPDNADFYTPVMLSSLPANWRSDISYKNLRRIGAEWYSKLQSLILKVPSAIIVNEYNFIINTQHPDFKKHVTLVRIEDYFWDARILK
jgi:RES domain-containing protein